MLFNALRSLIITLLVSVTCAWPMTYLGVGFISGILFFTVLQFVGFYFYSGYVQRKKILSEQLIALEEEKLLSKITAEVTCPCDRNVKALVPINLDDRNEYKCPGCEKTIHIIPSFKTALVTTPVSQTVEQAIISHGNKSQTF